MVADSGRGKARRIRLGEITRAHGIRGAVVVRTHTANPTDIAAYGPLEDASGSTTYTLTVEREIADGVVAHLDGIGDRTAAERLRGTTLYIARDRLPTAPDHEYYYADLVGLSVVTLDGSAIGHVVSVANYGAGDILEIRRTGGSDTELIPFSEAFVHRVALEDGEITVSLPDPSASTDD